MNRYRFACCLCLLIAAPAWGQDGVRPRLVPGGGGLGLPGLADEGKTALLSAGGFSLGTLAVPTLPVAAARSAIDGLALGGYAAYSADWLRLSSSLTGGNGVGAADMTAAQAVAPWGFDGVAALSLGYQWTQANAFSLNPAQMGVSASNLGQASDLSLSLSFTHDVTPSFALGGFAAASHGEEDGREPNNGIHFGAGLELKF